MALYRLTCTVNVRTTPVQDAVVALMKELGADQASIHLSAHGEPNALEHYMTMNRMDGGYVAGFEGGATGEMIRAAFDNRWMLFTIPRMTKKHKTKNILYRFNMIPGDTAYSRHSIKNGTRQVCTVPLFMSHNAGDPESETKKLGVLTLKGERLEVQDIKQTGTLAVQKAALLVACGARLLSRIVDARFDPLTGLATRLEFETQLGVALKNYMRGGPNFSIFIFDVDLFKQFNDRYGHDTGDQVLKTVAKAIGKCLRGTPIGDVIERRANGHNEDVDLCYRYGGEEFAAILPRTELQEALIIAERLRACIEQTLLEIGGRRLGITVSVGVGDADTIITRTSTRALDINMADIVHDVDLAMYMAKSQGRNIVAYSVNGLGQDQRYSVYRPGASEMFITARGNTPSS